MTTLNIAYGTRTEFPNDGNLNGMTSGQSKAIGAVTNTATLADGYIIDATLYLATTGVTSTGTISFYLLESADLTNYTDGINVTTTSDQTSSLKNAASVCTVNANANSQIVRVSFAVPRQFVPKQFSFLVSDNFGAALSTASNSVWYTPITYTNA